MCLLCNHVYHQLAMKTRWLRYYLMNPRMLWNSVWCQKFVLSSKLNHLLLLQLPLPFNGRMKLICSNCFNHCFKSCKAQLFISPLLENQNLLAALANAVEPKPYTPWLPVTRAALEDVDRFLLQWSLLDHGMSKAERVLQHAWFRRVKFSNAVTEANKRLYLHELV